MNYVCTYSLLDRSLTPKNYKESLAQFVTRGTIQDSHAFSRIVNAVFRFSDAGSEHNMLSLVHHPNTFTYDAVITSCAGANRPAMAISHYKLMTEAGLSPDLYTFPAILKSCSKFSGIEETKQFHGSIVKRGFERDLYIQNALVHVYAACGEHDNANQVFVEIVRRDVVSWTAIISGLVRAGKHDKALQLFLQMDVKPNAATVVSALSASARLGMSGTGRGIHGILCKSGFQVGLILGNALIDLYVKCGCLDDAHSVFNQMDENDLVSWTTLISGLVQNNRPKDALKIFHEMQTSSTEPDKITLTSVLSACSSLGALDTGRWIHEYMKRSHVEWDAHIGTSLVDMYAKCGSIERALHVFHAMHHKNVLTWNAIIGGLAMHGHGKEAVDYFSKLIASGIRPSEVTFLVILGSCAHSGLVEEGIWHFNCMRNVYNLVPKIEHYGCMVDLFSRAGLLEETIAIIKSMPMKADIRIRGAMLSACKIYGDVGLCEQILGHVTKADTCDSGVYVLISNIYAVNNRWNDVRKVRDMMKGKRIRKSPGSSFIEVNNRIHEFVVGGSKHPQQNQILFTLGSLTRHTITEGLLNCP